MDKELEGRQDQYIDNITGEPSHKCIHESDWKDYHTFKDKVLEFIGAKEAKNGALDDKDNSLDGRLNRIEGKVDKLLFFMLTSLVGLIIAIITLID